jgi:hypothetical protein
MSTPTELLKKQLQIQLMNTDLFARQKVTLANPQFTYQNEYNKGDFQWVEKLTGTGTATHDPLDATVALNVLATGDKVIRQTRKYMRYFSGKTLSLLVTFFTDAMPSGVRFRVGYFDGNNGAFFERVNGINYCVLRSSGVDQRVAQTSWNKDTFSDYDFNKSTIFNINLQWLGVGNVQFIFEDTDGSLVPVHVFENVGMIESTYMRTANLPVRYELESISHDGSYTAKQICSSVVFEDGGCQQVSAYEHSASNGITPVAVTTRRCVLAVRPKLEFNSIENRADAIINAVELIAGTNDAYWELVYNPTFGGTPTWASVNGNSTLEFSVNATTITGGIVVKSGFVAAGSGNTRSVIGSQINSNYPLSLDIDGANPTSYAIVCTSFTGTSNVNAAMDLREIY